eukprot:230788_1
MITPTQRATILINLSFSFAPHNIHLSKLTLSCFRSIYCLFILFHLIQFLSCFHSYHKGHSWSSPLSSELCMYLAVDTSCSSIALFQLFDCETHHTLASYSASSVSMPSLPMVWNRSMTIEFPVFSRACWQYFRRIASAEPLMMYHHRKPSSILKTFF